MRRPSAKKENISLIIAKTLFRVSCKYRSADVTIISLITGIAKQPRIDPKGQKSAVHNSCTKEAIAIARKRFCE
jgi:hypothetical protein